MRTNPERVTAVERALALLDAFTIEDASLSLTELARRVALPKTSTLRLARTLAGSGYLVQLDDGAWRLGPAAAWLGARYQVAFDIHDRIEPVMREMALSTGRSVSYFVHDGNARVRLLQIAAEDGEGGKSRVGEPMPLERGSPGLVLLAFTGQAGKLYDEIRKRGYHATIGEAKRFSASVAAPVFGARWNVVGALCIGVPAREATEPLLQSYAPLVMRAAEKLSRELSAAQKENRPLSLARASWHPG